MQKRRMRKRNRVAKAVARGVAMLLAAGILGVLPGAWADVCSSCPDPTLANLLTAQGFDLQPRDGEMDYVEYDGGECSIDADDPTEDPPVAFLALRGAGEVWDCPHSKMTSRITVTTAATDLKEWTLSGSVTVGGSALGLGFSASLESAVRNSLTLTRKTEVSYSITPGYCHRVAWKALFEIHDRSAQVGFTVTRRYAWWTKNKTTGSTVHAKGDVQVECGSGTATFTARDPINAHFDLTQRGCADPDCGFVITKSLGLFPPFDPPPPDPLEGGESGDPNGSGSDPAAGEGTPPGDPDAAGNPETDGVEVLPEPDPTVAPTGPITGPIPPDPEEADPAADDGAEVLPDPTVAPTGPITGPIPPDPEEGDPFMPVGQDDPPAGPEPVSYRPATGSSEYGDIPS